MNNASRVNEKLPPGFHFEPSPQELILHYLLKKVKGLPLHPMIPIIECDLYDDEERWRNVFEQDRRRKFRYFFTKVKRKTEKSSRCNRETGYGTWKGQNQSKVYDRRLIGFDGLFTYKAKREFEGNNDNWVMHEYSLGGSMHLAGNDYVVCRVENKNEEGIVLAKHNPHPEFSNDAGINDTNRARPVASLEVQSNNIQLTETVTAMDGLLESVIATRMTTQVKEVQLLKEDASNPNPLHAQEEGKTWLNFIPVASLEVQSNNIQLTETVTAMDGLLESVVATRMTTQVKEVQLLKEDASNPNPLHAQEEGKTWLNFIAR